MLIEEELSKEAPVKTSSNLKGKGKDNDKRARSSK